MAINAIFGSDGLITRAQQAKELTEMSSIKDRMELAKAEAYLDGNGKITADHYFDILEEEGIIVDKEKDVVDNEDGTYEVTTEPGYVFEVTITEDGDVEIDYVGKGENIGPRIREIKITGKTTNSVTVEVDARNVEDADYTYSYQKVGESEWKDAGTSKNNTCTIENLEANESYTIKVKVKTANGEDEDEISTTIGELPEGTITFGQVEWLGDGTASVAINTSEEGYQLQYQKNGIEGQWTTIGSGEKITGLVHNDTVYGRLFDGTNGTKEEASVSIQDGMDPVVTVSPGGTTTNSITVNVVAVDNESGMKDNPTYNYYIKKTSEDDSSYALKGNTLTETSYTFTGLTQETSYDVKVEVVGDKAGRKGTGTLPNQTTGKVGGATGDLTTGNIVASTPTWASGSASITLTTSTGLQIQYQINGITEGSWTTVSTGATVSGLHHNDTVYARLYDGTNTGDYGSVSIQDGIDPVVTVSPGGTTTNSIQVSVSAVDNESGMADSLTYTYYIKKTSEADTSYVAKANNIAQNSYTFTGLTQETSYDIKVEVTGDKAGRKGTGTLLNQTTGKVGGATGDLTTGNIVASSPTWSNGEASITLTTTTGLQIQYQVNGINEGNWTTVSTGATVSGLNHNDTVYARLWDGNNAGDEASISIQDGIDPVVTVSPGGTTTNSITVSVSAVDNESGMADSPTYTYYIKKSTEADSSYVAKANGIAQNSYTFTGLTQETSYDVKVEVTGDKAGRKGTGTLANQTTGKVGGATSGLTTGNIVASSPTWSGGSASITLTTSTGMKIQYQKNSISGSWTTITSGGKVTGLKHNDTVYARLWDGNNAGDYGSVSIIDNIAPTVSISTSNLTYNSVTLKVTASDGQSGLETSGTYKYYLGSTLKTTSTSNSYTYTGLTAETSYTLKVIVTDKAGKTTEKSTTIKTKNTGVADIVGGSDFTKTTEVEDDEGNSIWIPGGFNVAEDSATKEDEGIVIEDSKGNQFVWVPVEDYTTMYTEGTKTLNGVTTQTTVYSKLRVRSGDTSSYTPTTPGTTSGIREPDVLSRYDTDSQYYSILGASSTKDMADKMVAEYKATYESIKKYKGFYIGRYELTGSVASPTVQKGQTVLADQNWYNLKKACTNIVSTSYAQTTMIYGNQWDEVMSWLKTTEFASDPSKVDTDSSSWGNYGDSIGTAATGSGTKRASGYNEAWQANNIYDLAGNCFEWTQEANIASRRVYRGGYYYRNDSHYPASDRGENSPNARSSSISSRPALYIK